MGQTQKKATNINHLMICIRTIEGSHAFFLAYYMYLICIIMYSSIFIFLLFLVILHKIY